MTCMRSPILEEASVEVVPNEFVVSNASRVLELGMSKDCELTGLLGYFDIFFDLPVPVMFSTGPQDKATHWKQTVFFLPDKLPVKQGQQISCKIVCKRMRTDARALKVAITLD